MDPDGPVPGAGGGMLLDDLPAAAYLLLRHEQEPLQDLGRPGADDGASGGTKPAPGSRDDS